MVIWDNFAAVPKLRVMLVGAVNWDNFAAVPKLSHAAGLMIWDNFASIPKLRVMLQER